MNFYNLHFVFSKGLYVMPDRFSFKRPKGLLESKSSTLGEKKLFLKLVLLPRLFISHTFLVLIQVSPCETILKKLIIRGIRVHAVWRCVYKLTSNLHHDGASLLIMLFSSYFDLIFSTFQKNKPLVPVDLFPVRDQLNFFLEVNLSALKHWRFPSLLGSFELK